MPLKDQTASQTISTNDTDFIGRGNSNDPWTTNYTDFPNTNAILQPRESSWTPTTLGSTTKTYIGTQDDITQLATFGVQYYFSYSTKELPDELFSITFSLPYDEITNEDNKAPELVTWDIVPNSINRSLFNSGIYFVQPNGTLSVNRYTIPPVLQDAVVRAVHDNRSIDQSALISTNNGAYAQYAGITQQFYNLLRADITSAQSFTITVKRSATYSILDPNAYDNLPKLSTSINDQLINPIISTQDLTDLYQIPTTTAQFLIPSYSRFITTTATIGNAPADPITMLVYGGYLIKKPTRQFITPTKVQITQEFVFDEWVDQVYSLYSNTTDFPLIAETPYPNIGSNN